MNQRLQNDHLRVKKSGKYFGKNTLHQLNAIPERPKPKPKPKPQTQTQPQVYIINKEDFKSIVQQLTSSQSCERLPHENPPKRQKTRPATKNRTSPVPPNTMAVQEDPDVSLYMRYLQSLLEEDSSESNGDIFQQPFDEYHSQAHSQPQVPKDPMPESNVVMPTILPSSWFDGSPEQMHNAYSLQSTRVDYPQSPTSDFTFLSMTEPGAFGPDLGRF